MLHTFLWYLIALCAGHALCDYPLQGDFLARGKNHTAPLPFIPWQRCLEAHALIQAGMVLAVTGNTTLALMEFVVHAAVDWAKCEGWFGFNVDQIIHYATKLLWAQLLTWGVFANAST
jgi:hypothetical protein